MAQMAQIVASTKAHAMTEKPESRNKLGWIDWLAVVVGAISLILWGIAAYPTSVTAKDLLLRETCDAAMGAGILGILMLAWGIPFTLVSAVSCAKAKALPLPLRKLIIVLPALAVVLGVILLLAAT